jgi:hypothetical protein
LNLSIARISPMRACCCFSGKERPPPGAMAGAASSRAMAFRS